MSQPYAPCRTGIHICGKSADELEPVTVANFPMRSANAAYELFDELRTVFAARDGEPTDLIVDYCSAGDITMDFPLCRQRLEALREHVANAAR